MKYNWYIRKIGEFGKVDVFKAGNYKVLEIYKRPHKGYCCIVFNKGETVAMEGYHGTSLPKKYLAVRWGMKKARQLQIII